MPGEDIRGSQLNFGSLGLKAIDRGWLSSRQIEAARRAMTRHIRRGGKVWIRVFPDKVVTKTADEVGMGGGKGAPDHFVAVVRPGRILFEIDGVEPSLAKEALQLGANKLSVPTRVIEKQ